MLLGAPGTNGAGKSLGKRMPRSEGKFEKGVVCSEERLSQGPRVGAPGRPLQLRLRRWCLASSRRKSSGPAVDLLSLRHSYRLVLHLSR